MFPNGNLCMNTLNRSIQHMNIHDAWNNPHECVKNMDSIMPQCMPRNCGVILGASPVTYTHSIGQGLYGTNGQCQRLNRSRSLNRCKSPGAGLILSGTCMTPCFNRSFRNSCNSLNNMNKVISNNASCMNSINVGNVLCQPMNNSSNCLVFSTNCNTSMQCQNVPRIDSHHYVNKICQPCIMNKANTCLPIRQNSTLNCDLAGGAASCNYKQIELCPNVCPKCKRSVSLSKGCCSCTSSRPVTPVCPQPTCSNHYVQTEPCCRIKDVFSDCKKDSVNCQTECFCCDTSDACCETKQVEPCKPETFNWSIQTESPKIANTWVAHTMELCQDEDSQIDERSYVLTPRHKVDSSRYSSNNIITGGGGCGYSSGRTELSEAEMGIGSRINTVYKKDNNLVTNLNQNQRYYRVMNQEESTCRSEEKQSKDYVTRITPNDDSSFRGRRLVDYTDDEAAKITYGIKEHEHFTEDINGREKIYINRTGYDSERERISIVRSPSPNPSLFSETGCGVNMGIGESRLYYPSSYRYKSYTDEQVADTSGYSSDFNLTRTKLHHDD